MKRPLVVASVVASLLAFASPSWALVHGFDGSDGDQACQATIDWSCLPTDWDLVTAADGTGSTDVVFDPNSKEEVPDEWDFTTGGPGDKTDILNVWSAWREPGDDSYLFLAFNRSAGEGNAFFTFELNQKDSTWANKVGETIPCRSDDDVLVSYQIPSTTTDPVALTLYRWQGSGPAACPDGATGKWLAAPTLSTGAEGGINDGEIPSTLTGAPLADATFGEAALDLSAVAQAVGITAPCEYFTRLQAHSRSSSSFSSSMGDYVASGDVSVAACKDDTGGGSPPALPTISADAGCHTDGRVTLSGATDPGTWVRVRDRNGSVGVAHDADADGDWSLTVEDVANGETFTAQAYNAANKFSAITAATAPVTVDTQAPAAPVVNGPASITAGDDATLSGTAQPNSTISVSENGSEVATTTADANGDWTVTLQDVAAGDHTYSVTAADTCATGAATTHAVSAVIPPSPPALPTIATDTGCHTNGNVVVSGTTDPGTSVQVSDRNGLVGTATDSDNDGTWSLTVTDVADGETFTAQAIDADLETSAVTAPTAPVTVDTVAPAAPTITSPAAGAEIAAGTVTLSGTAQPGSTVTITEDGGVLATTAADGAGAWSTSVAGVTAGAHDVDVDATYACATGATTRLSFTAKGTTGDPDPDPDGDGDPNSDPNGTSGNTGGGGATVTQPSPQIQVLGQTQCSSKKFTLAVPGKGLKRVVFKVDGRKVKTDKSKNGKGAFTLGIDPKKFSSGNHRVTATLVPVKGKARVVPLRSFQRCEKGKCVSRRAFKIRVKKAKGEKIVSAKVFVNGKRVKVVKGARLRAGVKLTGLPKGRFTVRIQARTESGRVINDVRKYRTCTKKKAKKPTKKS